MLGIVALAEVARRGHELTGADDEAARLDAAEDFPGEAAPDRVRLDQDQRALNRHGAGL